MSEIQLGDRVKDKISGIVGVVVSRTDWLYDCVRFGVQPEGLKKDGTKADIEYFDEPQMQIVKAGAFKPFQPTYVAPSRRTGGPARAEPPSQH